MPPTDLERYLKLQGQDREEEMDQTEPTYLTNLDFSVADLAEMDDYDDCQ